MEIQIGYYNYCEDYIEGIFGPTEAKWIMKQVFDKKAKFLFAFVEMNEEIEYFNNAYLFALFLEANWEDIMEDWEWRVNN